jgi:hypothetical protein
VEVAFISVAATISWEAWAEWADDQEEEAEAEQAVSQEASHFLEVSVEQVSLAQQEEEAVAEVKTHLLGSSEAGDSKVQL